MSNEIRPQNKEVSSILQRAVEIASERSQSEGRPISYEGLLPYVLSGLPILVEKALSQSVITYEDFGRHIHAGNSQNANRPFAAIKEALRLLGNQPLFSGLGDIPNLTLLVVNKGSESSGSGAFEEAPEIRSKSKEERLAWLKDRRVSIYKYPRWLEVLSALELAFMQNLEPDATNPMFFLNQQGGEGALHGRLKEFVRANTEAIYPKLKSIKFSSTPEFRFWSGDCLDVHTATAEEWLGFEVKTSEASFEELMRGLFQVVKYTALLSGTLLMQGRPLGSKCVLAAGGRLPQAIREVAVRLNVETIEELESVMNESQGR